MSVRTKCPECNTALKVHRGKARKFHGIMRLDEGLTLDDMEEFAREQQLHLGYKDLEKITDKWGYIRQAYMEQIPDILDASYDDLRGNIDPYFMDWGTIFTPIESAAWGEIRGMGLPFYPQFPLFNYFIDFANPYMRIGLECDGKDWHDKEKDTARDTKLAEYGWRIFRVTGAEANRILDSPGELMEECSYWDYTKEECYERTRDDVENWFYNTVDGVLSAISRFYFPVNRDHYDEYFDISARTLDQHRLVDFDLIDEGIERKISRNLKE